MPSANIKGRLDLIVENIRGYGRLTEYVRRDEHNPFPETHPLHDSFVSYQVPYLNGIEVYGINHPYSFGNYWTNFQQPKVGDVLYASVSADLIVSSISEEISGYAIATNNTGVITNFVQIIHSNSLSLSGVKYYYDGNLSNGTTILYPLSNTNVFVNGLSGIWDVDGDTVTDRWKITNGVISWTVGV